jgi:hypothetical protein
MPGEDGRWEYSPFDLSIARFTFCDGVGVAYLGTTYLRSGSDTWRAGKTQALAQLGVADGETLVLNEATQEKTRIVVPTGIFKQELRERTGGMWVTDQVLGPLYFRTGAQTATFPAFAELAGSSVEAREMLGNVAILRLKARLGPSLYDGQIYLWIEEVSGLLRRTVYWPREETGPHRNYIETVYRYDFTCGAVPADYDLEAYWFQGLPDADSVTFADPQVIAKLLGSVDEAWMNHQREEEKPAKPPARPVPFWPTAPTERSTPPVASAPEPSDKPSPPPAASSDPKPAPEDDTQLLTSEQMASIVLIEGDDGVGTGFIARLRGVDFVVTNVHVIGGNKTLRAKTLTGVTVQLGAIFAASGRDVAILRIEGENAAPALKIADDPLKSAKLGDKIAVVGNRRGGGVATQLAGAIRGLGPDRLEIDAKFQPGNSGSPIIHLASGEVIGLAAYAELRDLDVMDIFDDLRPAPSDELGGSNGDPFAPKSNQVGNVGAEAQPQFRKTEQRWFGFRLDGVSQWEAIQLTKWNAQAKQIADFQQDTLAINYAMFGVFERGPKSPRVQPLIDRLMVRLHEANRVTAAQTVNEFFFSLKAVVNGGVRELNNDEFYDFFRSCEYWDYSIPMQLKAREQIKQQLEDATQQATALRFITGPWGMLPSDRSARGVR